MQTPSIVQPEVKRAPLSYQQEWAVSHWLQPENVYVVECVIRMIGEVNVECLHRSLEEVVQRHDALRTRIVPNSGVLEQHVDVRGETHLEIIDLRDVPVDAREDEAHQRIGHLISKRRNLAQEMPARFALLKCSEYSHLLACVMQHIVCDHLSVGVFIGELWRLYGDFIQGRPSSLSEFPLQYSDYAISQHAEQTRWVKEHESFWRSTLYGASRVQLPYDHGLSGVQRFSGGYTQTCFSGPLSSALRSLSRRQKVTLATVMLVIYAIVLSCWSDQQDLVIPFAVPGRCGVMQMKMIGQLAEYLPLRLTLRGDETVLAMFKRVSQLVLAACEHLDFGRIVSNSPEFFNGTSLNWFPSLASRWIPSGHSGRNDGVVWEWFACKCPAPLEHFSKLTADMGCNLIDADDCIVACLIYRTDLFGAVTMERFLEDLKQVAERVVGNPLRSVSSLQRWRDGPGSEG